MTFGELFAGIGGFSLGLERAGMSCKWQVEIDKYAAAVLRKHWPYVPKHDDVRTFPPKGDYYVDIICGGFPCQDISNAGAKKGIRGERSGLWGEFARIVSNLRPKYVIVENVAAILHRGMGDVLGELASLGYDAEWHCIPACSVGSPQFRDRTWVIAYDRCRRLSRWKELHCERSIVSGWDDVNGLALAQRRARDARAWMRRADNGVPCRVDRLRCLGNAVVPQIVEAIGRELVKYEKDGAT